MGSLDKAVIRQVIRSHRDQIRGCYEAQLSRFSDLQGKVTVKFVISAEGAVAAAEVAQSSAGNPELEQCVASSVRTWTFPKPRGGGVVVVTYPFIFQQTPAPGDPERDETDPRVALEDGVALYRKRQYQKAEPFLVRCLELDPASAECHLVLGSIYARQRKTERGAEHYREFLRLAPDHERAPEIRAFLKDYDDHRKRREMPRTAPGVIEI